MKFKDPPKSSDNFRYPRVPSNHYFCDSVDLEECDAESFFKWLESLPPVPKDTVRTL